MVGIDIYWASNWHSVDLSEPLSRAILRKTTIPICDFEVSPHKNIFYERQIK